jgi:hypothetical protein
MRALADEFQIGHTTTLKIIDEVCEAVRASMQEIYLTRPTAEDWIESEVGFADLGFPHAIGALDGKHFWVKVLKLTNKLKHYNFSNQQVPDPLFTITRAIFLLLCWPSWILALVSCWSMLALPDETQIVLCT